MKVAIVGEGPTGLMCIAKLLHSISITPSKCDIEITWFKARQTYVRRHVVNISRKFVKEIEEILDTCIKCINTKNTDKDLSLSIRTLEYVMNRHVEFSPAFKEITSRGTFNYKSDVDEFDHIFFCDGANSSGRKTVLYDERNPYEPIYFKYGEPIVILYSGLGPKTINTHWNPINNMSSRKVYLTNKMVTPYDITLQTMYDILSIFYNIRKNSVLYGAPFTPLDLWASGYDTYDNLQIILEEIATFLKGYLQRTELSTFYTNLRSTGAFIDKSQEDLCESIKTDNEKLDRILETIFNIIQDNITKRTNIVLSPVLPKIQTYGISFNNENKVSLQYAKTVNHTACYLLGDSANAFPPGNSLEISLQSAFHVMDIFYSFFCSGIDIPFTTFNYNDIQCSDTEQYLHGNFFGGYSITNKYQNSLPHTLDQIKTLVESSYSELLSTIQHTFIEKYNMYMFDIFLYYSKKLLCKGTFQLGGGRRRKYKKSKRIIRQIRHTRKLK